MFEGVKNGWDLIKASIKVFNKYPIFLVPIFLVWLVYAPMILYLKYFFPWDIFSFSEVISIVFIVLFIFTILLCFSCSIVLELIQQLETEKKFSLLQAMRETIGKNMLKVIPLAIIWAIIWLILTIIEALLSKSKERRSGRFTAENAAKTLVGYGRFSFNRAFFEALNKGVRMVVFLILPAIAWEDLGFFRATRKGLGILKTNLSTFVTGFTLTYLAALIVFLPPGILFYISEEMELTLPDFVWVITIIYIGFAWSYSMYLEQMFTANLYLWHMKWEKEVEKAKEQGKPLPKLRDVPRPSILDDVPDLLEKD